MFDGGDFTNFSQIIFDASKNLHNILNINIGDLLQNSTTVSKNINKSSWYMFSYFFRLAEMSTEYLATEKLNWFVFVRL
jgi:hypothetical protein